MARRDDRPEIRILPPTPAAPPVAAGPPTAGPPSAGAGAAPPAAGAKDPSGAGGAGRAGRSGRDDEGSDRWRWAVALSVVLAVVAAVIVFDRRGPKPAEALPPTTVAAKPVAPSFPGEVTETQLPIPSGLEGTLYAVTDDDRLAEIDLATGRSRLAELSFEVQPWLVTQVVALQDAVLISTRRQVYVIDRATLSEQSRVADARWVVASPDGTWAALVPFGAASGEITWLDRNGMAAPGEALRLPTGVTVQGAVDDALVVDVVGSLQLLYRDGQSGPVIGAGKYLASGGSGSIARLVCAGLNCKVHAGTINEPDAVLLDEIELAGSWYFGPGAVFDPQGGRLAIVGAPDATNAVVQAVELGAVAPRRWSDSPIVPLDPGALPALAFTADGSTLVHTSAGGLVLWHVDGDAGFATATDEVQLSGDVLAVTVTPQPPPPPPQSAGPPPSYA